MKIITTLFFTMHFSSFLICQTQIGTYTFRGDTVKSILIGNERFGKAKLEARYSNNRLRCKGEIIDGLNKGNWIYYSIKGDTLSIINYDSLSIVQLDSSFTNNAMFTRIGLNKADSMMRYSFGENFVNEHIHLHHGSSKQFHHVLDESNKRKPNMLNGSRLYEPRERKIVGLNSIYSIKNNPSYWFAKISLDSLYKIRNINFNSKRRYKIKTNSIKIDSIAASKGWIEMKKNGYKSIIGEPNLSMQHKEPIWTISYCIMDENINEDWERTNWNQKCKYLIIHAETGEVKESLSSFINYDTTWLH